jgi:hypothetical protein
MQDRARVSIGRTRPSWPVAISLRRWERAAPGPRSDPCFLDLNRISARGEASTRGRVIDNRHWGVRS